MNKETVLSNTLPYAAAFVVYQNYNEDTYEPMDALKAGTIYPKLDKPYKGRWKKHGK